MQLRTRFRRALNKFFRVVRVRDRPELANDTRRPERRLALGDLPTEVLEHILGYITDEWKYLRLPSVSRLSSPLLRGTATPLKDISTVNRQLRALCCPILFRLIQLDPSGPLPPPSVLQHVRCMHVHVPTTPSWTITDDFMIQLHRLERVFWHGTRKLAPLGHLRLLLASPTLHTLILSNVWLQADTTDLSTVASRLRTLRIDFPRQVQSGTPAFPEFVNPNLDCLDAVFDALRPRLESLTLSGYSARLSSLAAAPWPSLRAFALTRGDAILDVPWATLLSRMPKLSSFTVALDRAGTPNIIFPDADAAAHANPLPELHHLTISFPHPDDPLFCSLPSGLRELSLRDTPRYYMSRSRWREESDFEPILSCPDVSRIFTVLPAESLSALELVYLEDDEEPKMLALLSQACPNLTLLELHRYPAKPGPIDAWYHGTLSIPVEALADALAAFRSLRVLKLNLCVTKPDISRPLGALPADYWDRLALVLESHAQTVALRMPWIRLISLLAWCTYGMHWDTWSLFPGGAVEGPRLVHEDIYHASFEGCKEQAVF